MIKNDDAFDPPLTTDQTEKIRGLSEDEVKRIDNALLANASTQWRKVARVVGSKMIDMDDRAHGIPDVYYAQRIAALVSACQLESQGDLRRMRFGEIRLPKK